MKRHTNNILVPIDFSGKSISALEQSFILAKLIDLEITLLHVIQDSGFNFFTSLFSEDQNTKYKEEYEKKQKEKLQEIADEKSKKSGIVIHTMIAKGRTYSKILEIADTIDAKYIVMANSSTEVNHEKMILGTNSSRVVSKAKCPVLTVNCIDGSRVRHSIKKIVLPLDISKDTRQKVTKAVEFAKNYNSVIKLVVVLLTSESTIVKQLKTQLLQVENYIKKSGVQVTAEILHGLKGKDKISDIIVNYVENRNADLIMIMTQQENELMEYFIGSNAREILRKSTIPVMSIVPKEIGETSMISF
ncbi:MAG: universal stress protein [Saprospiraceae bacterium]|nr:universal stress protein [Saprospiraceae bacterium]